MVEQVTLSKEGFLQVDGEKILTDAMRAMEEGKPALALCCIYKIYEMGGDKFTNAKWSENFSEIKKALEETEAGKIYKLMQDTKTGMMLENLKNKSK